MLSREQTAELINQFLVSASLANQYFGSDELLNQIKSAYQALNETDKEYIQAHIKNKHNEKRKELYPPETKVRQRNEFIKETLTGAAIGMVGGAAVSGIYSVVKGKFLINKSITALTTFAGAFYYPALKHPEEIQKLKETQRVFDRIKSELGVGTAFTNFAHYAGRRNEECQKDLREGLRRRVT